MKVMSLESKSKPELEKLCQEYEIELPEGVRPTKKVLVHALEEMGITESTLRALNKKEKEEEMSPEVSFEGQSVIYMDRENPSFGFMHYKFSRDRRYVVMEEADARELLNTIPGFRRATRDEVLRFYNK